MLNRLIFQIGRIFLLIGLAVGCKGEVEHFSGLAEPYRSCLDIGRVVHLDHKIVPGLELISISGLPEDSTSSPQYVIYFNLMATKSLPDTMALKIYVNAEGPPGRSMIGDTWIPREHPPLNQWALNTCFPVKCTLDFPIAEFPICWEIKARIRVVGGDVGVLGLGKTTLMTNI